jgi:hypothetical protein
MPELTLNKAATRCRTVGASITITSRPLVVVVQCEP